MTQPSLPEKVMAVHDRLSEIGIGHAFGGALALAYYAEPRATIDIDVNVFIDASEHEMVEAALTPLGIDDGADPAVVERDGQTRLWWGTNPIDIFYAYLDFHRAMQKASRRVDFASRTIPILAPEHLAACKVIFNRPKDWLDVEQMLVATPDMRRGEAIKWIDGVIGHDDPRSERFKALAAQL